jgi:hypothetical protein
MTESLGSLRGTIIFDAEGKEMKPAKVLKESHVGAWLHFSSNGHGTNRIPASYCLLWDAQVQLVGSTPGSQFQSEERQGWAVVQRSRRRKSDRKSGPD